MKSPTVVLPAGVQVPRVRHVPPSSRANSYEDVVELMAAYGTVFEPWQENVFAGALGERMDGTWAAKTVGVSCPRQNGKGTIEEGRALAGLLLFGERLIIASAHEVRTAQIMFQRIKAYFENYDDLRKKVANIGNAVAREYIRLRGGQEIRFVTRSKSAIRGFSADCLLLDEAQILGDLQWEAILYTVSARPAHQIWLFGTPPASLGEGVVFGRFRDIGLEGKDHRSAWFEWSAPADCDLDDPHAWAAANPALGDGRRILYDTVVTERAVASDESFARERLGIWASRGVERVISPESWLVCANPSLVDNAEAPVCFAIDVAPDRGSASICAAAWTLDGLPFVDVVETRRGDPDWGVAKIVGMCDRHNVRAVVVDAAGPAASLVDPLRQCGITVTVTTARQMSAACGGFYDAVMDGYLRHLDQPILNTALSVARRRAIGDTGWGWSRKDSESDITPLTTATLALWGLVSSEVAEVPRPRTGQAVFV
jgi:phage terminase large subunit-like protein